MKSASADPAPGESADTTTQIAVSYLSGSLRQRRTGVGWKALRDLPESASSPSLTVEAVDAAFAALAEVAGAGAQARRRSLVRGLFGSATAQEQRFLALLAGGELRQGALDGVMTEAVALATGVPSQRIRSATMLRGSVAPVAVAVLTRGEEALGEFGLLLGRGVQPMLAQSATSVAEALSRTGMPAAVEEKLDGIRVQVHRNGDEVLVLTRTLDDITARMPEVVSAVLQMPCTTVVLDGEVIALRDDGRPEPFQVTGSRAATGRGTGGGAHRLPLTCFFFDVLHLDGADLLGLHGAARWSQLERVVPADQRVARLVTSDAEEGRRFFEASRARGQEGVVVKSLAVPYEAGRRGAGWVKVKQVHTLDLVVLAVEWGSGRRQGWLSNLHLGARDSETGDFVMLGKTFKGLTDELLRWQTDRFLALETRRTDHVVHVRPEVVVEIALDGVQTSSRYPAGMALRFARVLRYREDKRPDEADTVATVRALHAGS